MDVSSIRRDIEYVNVFGETLSPEEQTILQSCIPILATQNKVQDLQFWGKVCGTTNDYVVAVGYKTSLLHDKIFLATSDVMGGVGTWFQLDSLDAQTSAQCGTIRGRFSGIASKEYIVESSSEGADGEDGGDTQSINESTRLAYIVSTIDTDTHIIPRGVLMQQPQGEVYINKAFEGLNGEDSKQVGSYVYRRSPQSRTAQMLIADKGADKSTDFLDRLSDIPEQHWVLRDNGIMISLRNLYWPGSVAYHKPMSSTYGFSYFGTGEPTTDLGFAL